jgi:hypothetical protein
MRRNLLRGAPLRYRPVTHLVLAGYLAFMAFLGVRIWRRSLASGVLDVRGPALHLAHEPLLYWLAMAGAAGVILLVAVAALLAVRAFWLNVRSGREAT